MAPGRPRGRNGGQEIGYRGEFEGPRAGHT